MKKQSITSIRAWSFHQLSHIVNVCESLHCREDRNVLLQRILAAFRDKDADQCILLSKPRHITPTALLRLLTCGIGANIQRVEAKVRGVLCSNVSILATKSCENDDDEANTTLPNNENIGDALTLIPMTLDARISLRNMHAWYNFVESNSNACAHLPVMRSDFEVFFDQTGCNASMSASAAVSMTKQPNDDVFDGRFCHLCVKMLQQKMLWSRDRPCRANCHV